MSVLQMIINPNSGLRERKNFQDTKDFPKESQQRCYCSADHLREPDGKSLLFFFGWLFLWVLASYGHLTIETEISA